jgi:hypothetical protein
VAFERLPERGPLDCEIEGQVAFLVLRSDRGREIGGELDAVAMLQPPRALGESAPEPAAQVAVERHLDSCGPAPAVKPCWDDAGVVEDQDVVRPQQRGQVHHQPVLDFRPHHQEPRRVARFARRLRDQRPGQRKIEFVDSHAGCNPRLAETMRDTYHGLACSIWC